MFVLGTAGHIDHGKSFLVRALTGIDPDRLREEKERGMTLDLGFAWLKLPSGQEVGIIDVPGHERLIKNMVAGIGGIDLALLVIDANEGVMPQTREHLAILELLGIKRGVVTLTKKDLVNDEWLNLVKSETEKLLESTTLAGAPLVAVSALTGEGLPDLIATIDRLLSDTPPKPDTGRPRLPIDRVFTLSGSGTVVTGTLIDGSLTIGQEVEIVPPSLKSRIRGLETHKSRVTTATPGNRVGANLVGIATSQLERGDVITRPGWLVPTDLLTVQLKLLPYLRHPIRHNTTVNFHTGAAQALAKVRLLEREELTPGETVWAQLALSKPVALIKGDRFIIRSSMETLGGGEIIESRPRRHRRFRPEIAQSLSVKAQGTTEDMILSLLEAKQPRDISSLIAQSDLTADEVKPAVASLMQQGKVIELGKGANRLLLTQPGWSELTKRATSILEDYHQRFPTRSGMPRAEFGSRLKIGTRYAEALPKLAGQGTVVDDGTAIRLSSHQVKLTPAQQARVENFLKSLAANPYTPPSNLIPEADLLSLLISQGQVVKITEDVVFATPAYDEMVARITKHLKSTGRITVAEVRDMFQTSRKYAVALLEHLDGKKVTRRVGDERVLY
jgi:selenocysteine-specific elongation factor